MTEIRKADIAFSKAERFRTDKVCRGCEKCIRACPAGIDIPSLLLREERKNAGEEEHSMKTGGQPIDCIECGICSIRCPQGFHLLEIVRRYAMQQASEYVGGGFSEENEI